MKKMPQIIAEYRERQKKLREERREKMKAEKALKVEVLRHGLDPKDPRAKSLLQKIYQGKEKEKDKRKKKN